jgi:hypothetical protein
MQRRLRLVVVKSLVSTTLTFDIMPNLPNLYRQKRLAMALFGAGQRKVWLDPSKKELIERAKSRECGVQWRAVACD